MSVDVHMGSLMADGQSVPADTTSRPTAVAVVSIPHFDLLDGNAAALDALDIEPDQLPVPRTDWLVEDDWGLLDSRVVPTLGEATAWSGDLRFTARPGEGALPVMIVPHLGTGADANTATMVIAAGVSTGDWTGVPDPLTGLPTRAVLIDRLTHALSRSERTGDLLATLFVDLDGLKRINDQFGHEVGDTTLIEASQRIRRCLRVEDTVARFGGDEFVILCESVDDEDHARHVADRILEELAASSTDHPIAASVGISFARGGGIDALDIISRADTAMYRAKTRGGARAEVFDREMQNRQEEDHALRDRLLDAISSDNLAVAAQPMFELQTGRVTGVELFIRVRDRARAFISAADVLRLAREHSEAIDAAVIRRALGLVRAWRNAHGADAPRLHVNLSAQSLASERFASRIIDACRSAHVRPSALALEIDTADLVRAPERHLATIQELRSAGFLIVVDGYGAGLVSLRTIAALQPAMVKITGLERNNASPIPYEVVTALVRAMVGLGVATCVKGIESRPMLNHAINAGAFAGQGNALSAVGPIERVNELLGGPLRIGF